MYYPVCATWPDLRCWNSLQIPRPEHPEVIMMDETLELSLEQQFRQRAFETLVSRMSPEQAKDILVKLHKQMLLQEATYRQLLRHSLSA